MKIVRIPSKAIICDDFELSIIKKSLIEYHSFLTEQYDELTKEEDKYIIDQIATIENMLYMLELKPR